MNHDGERVEGRLQDLEAEAAERRGRKERATRFRVREVRANEVMEDDPRRYMLEVETSLGGRSTMNHLHALTEADIRALNSVTAQFLCGYCPAEK